MSAQSNTNAFNEAGASPRKKSGRPGTPGAVKSQRQLLGGKTSPAAGKHEASSSARPAQWATAPNRPSSAKATGTAAAVSRPAPHSRRTRNDTAPASGSAPASGVTSPAGAAGSVVAGREDRQGPRPAESASLQAGSGQAAKTVTTTATFSAPAPVAAAGGAVAAGLTTARGAASASGLDRRNYAAPGTGRLRSGQLRALVAQTLAGRGDDQFTVTQLSNMLRRSPGAIANAAETLCEQGLAVRTQQRPNTYQGAPTIARS